MDVLINEVSRLADSSSSASDTEVKKTNKNLLILYRVSFNFATL